MEQKRCRPVTNTVLALGTAVCTADPAPLLWRSSSSRSILSESVQCQKPGRQIGWDFREGRARKGEHMAMCARNGIRKYDQVTGCGASLTTTRRSSARAHITSGESRPDIGGQWIGEQCGSCRAGDRCASPSQVHVPVARRRNPLSSPVIRSTTCKLLHPLFLVPEIAAAS